MKKCLFFTLFIFCFVIAAFAQAKKKGKPYLKSNIDKGFAALMEYDYFKARKVFYTCSSKYCKAADFGLAIIYYRKDNPFHAIDSAYACINRSLSAVVVTKSKAEKKLLKWKITNDSILKLKILIEERAYEYVKQENSIAAYETYLQKYAQSNLISDATKNRNSLAFSQVLKLNTALAYQDFMSKYPAAQEVSMAKKNYELCQFKEYTAEHTVFVYAEFIKKFPQSPYILASEDSIFSISTQKKRQ